jgi:hypothetical protein
MSEIQKLAYGWPIWTEIRKNESAWKKNFIMCGCFLKSLGQLNCCSSSRIESETFSSYTVKLQRNFLINLNHNTIKIIVKILHFYNLNTT